MKKRIVIGLVGCVLAGVVWGKGPKPMVASGRANKAPEAAMRAQQAQHKAAVHGMQMRQQQAAKAAVARQHAMQAQQNIAAKQMRAAAKRMPPPTIRYAAPPPNLHTWRRGAVPHATYRSVWYGDVWYDAYGYPHYNPAVQPVVYQTQPVVVQPVAQPVVVQPAPAVVQPVAQPVVVRPAPAVVY